ncbi:hypothetical protein BVAVS116_H0049 (plasmid) [Borreliella valaisiana VS116]|uniref:Uncharacterized protein n=1 Tax=Borreliella valaisiana VS116 TaxID=445987 RepID=C0R9A6_BORVA|nr:hypothetical protein BVAVS116_H0049 [Borreliella valaisiana VS116]
MFNYDPEKRTISDRLKGLIPISSKVLLPSNMSNITYANSIPF